MCVRQILFSLLYETSENSEKNRPISISQGPRCHLQNIFLVQNPRMFNLQWYQTERNSKNPHLKMWNYQIFWSFALNKNLFHLQFSWGFLLCMLQLFPDSYPPDYSDQPVNKLCWSLIMTHSYDQVLEQMVTKIIKWLIDCQNSCRLIVYYF